MEYCEHGDLFDELRKSGPLSICRLRSYIYQLLKALQCLHEKGFAHRDLKPENILVASGSIVKLGDLGLAQALPPDGMMTTICGSLYYMAPEILRAVPYDGRKADIWSLGIIIFAMCLNRLPWASSDIPGMGREILDGTIMYPAQMMPEILEIVQICTKKNPSERPTARQLLEMPWISEETLEYKRLFSLTSRLSLRSSRDTYSASSAKIPSQTRRRPKLVLEKHPLRAFQSLDAKSGLRIPDVSIK
jgi:serine/threonine protein kinase